MSKIPLVEKYKYCNEVEIILIGEQEFVIKEINHIQSNYLHHYTEYFFNNPETFLPFLDEIIINKDDLYKFLGNKNNKIEYRNKLLNLINAICIQCLSISPISFDYTLSNEIKSISDNNLVINRFITILISNGYKKNEINNFSNKKIMQLALEELWIRSKTDCFVFIAEIITCVRNYKKQLPLSYDEFINVYNEWKDKIIFYSDEDQNSKAKFEFINKINNILNEKTDENQISNSKEVKKKKKSLAEIKAEKEEAKRQRDLLNSLPK